VVDRMSLPIINEALMAYTKGQLSLEVHLRIAQVLGQDPEAAARVATLRELNHTGRASHNRSKSDAGKIDHVSSDSKVD
jgi:anti-sigma factor RsiW